MIIDTYKTISFRLYPRVNISAHKHSIGTVVGAVATIAVFVMFATCLGFSIHRRRRNDARRTRDRDRQVETQSVHSDVSGYPSLLPRYFPGTQPTAPPPYVGPAEGSSVATQSDLSSISRYHQTPPPFGSTPSQPANGGVPPLVIHDREPSGLPPAISSASPPVYTSAMPQTAQQISPREHAKDTEPALVEVAPICLTAAIVPSSRPPRTSRRSRSSSLLDIDTATTFGRSAAAVALYTL
jgi:hypothetical protein